VTKSRRLITVLFTTSLFWAFFMPSANASINCRAEARYVQSRLLALSGQADEGKKMLDVLGISFGQHPECKEAINALMMWNGGGAQKGQPFPFPQSGDAFIYRLGPLSWWWNIVWNDWFGGNLILFAIFGWEIFLGGLFAIFRISLLLIILPIRLVVATVGFVISLITKPFRKSN
jgi:hypothetical protein